MDGLHYRFVLAHLHDGSWVWELRGEQFQVLIRSLSFPNKDQAKQAAKDFYAEVMSATFDFSDPN